ncbi:hypothetical protein [Millisia brevis]|uniref:hypothetical protein n=1 Tax=Millisia brevis TaxID=264148 RepID=UPI000830EDB6|nr:hypothetical protein [Millisia brevis]
MTAKRWMLRAGLATATLAATAGASLLAGAGEAQAAPQGCVAVSGVIGGLSWCPGGGDGQHRVIAQCGASVFGGFVRSEPLAGPWVSPLEASIVSCQTLPTQWEIAPPAWPVWLETR